MNFSILSKRLYLVLLSIIMLLTGCRERFHRTREARGLWVTRWEWTKTKPDEPDPAGTQQQNICRIFDEARRTNMNMILFQIRGNADAFYRSNYEPWSQLLTGTLGQEPDWDPLAFAIEQAHRRGLELHAWFNTFPAWRGTNPPPPCNPPHIINQHPEWLICDQEGNPMPLSDHYVSLSPGIPEVRNYLLRVVMDIVSHYDIDGLHFDYIRYPESADKLGYSHDSISVALFHSPEGNPNRLTWADWQRENINQFVRAVYDSVTHCKPWVILSAAVIGKYNTSSWNGYHVVFQDARQWLADSKIDFVAPMIYWPTTHQTAPFGPIASDWLIGYERNRYAFPGMMINRLDTRTWPLKELLSELAIVRDHGNGMIFFSYSGLETARQLLHQSGFPFPANPPAMPWKDNTPPLYPQQLRAFVLPDGTVRLEWSEPDSSDEVLRYNIFRSTTLPMDLSDARHLIYITAPGETSFIDQNVKSGRTYHYVVTALDRVNNESPPSNIATLGIAAKLFATHTGRVQ